MEDTLTELDKAAILAASEEVINDIERGVFADALKVMVGRAAKIAGRMEELGDDPAYVRHAVAALEDAREEIERGLDR